MTRSGCVFYQMRQRLSQLFILIGFICFLIPIGNLARMQYYKEQASLTWQLPLGLNSLDLSMRELFSMVYDEIPSTNARIGSVSYLKEIPIPLYQGIENQQLTKGLGHDPLSVLPGENGNCLIYGHREEFLWELQAIAVGDEIFVQTIYGTWIYEVNEIHVLNPDDSFIFEQTKTPTLTLVTCHPFIYFGPIKNRFVVRVSLIGKL